jgi:hypothetical protein
VLGSLTLLAAMITRNTLSHKRIRMPRYTSVKPSRRQPRSDSPVAATFARPLRAFRRWLLRPLRPNFLDIEPSGLVTGRDVDRRLYSSHCDVQLDIQQVATRTTRAKTTTEVEQNALRTSICAGSEKSAPLRAQASARNDASANLQSFHSLQNAADCGWFCTLIAR